MQAKYPYKYNNTSQNVSLKYTVTKLSALHVEPSFLYDFEQEKKAFDLTIDSTTSAMKPKSTWKMNVVKMMEKRSTIYTQHNKIWKIKTCTHSRDIGTQ